MFKVKDISSEEIIQVLDTHCDDYGKTWFLIWKQDGWKWRAADNYCPPNYNVKKKIIVAGSRIFNSYPFLEKILNEKKNVIKEIVSGHAKGADSMGETWAIRNDIPIKIFNADWEKFGSSAGFIRNHQMGDYADELIAFWDGQSPGTKDMIDYMDKLKKPVHLIPFLK